MADKKKGPKSGNGVPEGFVSANVPVEFWKPENAGESVRGHYQGHRVLPAKGSYKEQDAFDIADENGELIVLTGASLLRQFERVNEGDEVIVIFHGRKAMKDGKAPMKDFSVNVRGELREFRRNS